MIEQADKQAEVEPDDTVAVKEAPTPGSKRGPGAKELPPLQWKLVGMAGNVPVTLLRCIERTEAEAQLERLSLEHYYDELAIHPINAVVPISSAAAKSRRQIIDAAVKKVSARRERNRPAGSDDSKNMTPAAKQEAADRKAAATRERPTAVKKEAAKPTPRPAVKTPAKSAKPVPKPPAKSSTTKKPATAAKRKKKA